MSDWRTIDSAPKDGRRILGWCVFPGGSEVRLLSFAEWMHGWHWEAYGVAQNPTHWMPLPDPPVSK